MSENRKDNKGRILRAGESQRKDLIYQYRYTDIRGKRQTIYSREKKRRKSDKATPVTTPITTPFARKLMQNYEDLRIKGVKMKVIARKLGNIRP